MEQRTEARTLPFGIDHVRDVGEPGRRVEVVAAGGHDALMGGRPEDGRERHLVHVVDAAQVLRRLVGQ